MLGYRLLRSFCLLLLLIGSRPVAAQRFAVIGDYGSAGDPERDVAALVHGWNPDFVLTLGDNNYDRGDSATIDDNIGQYYARYIHPYKGRYGPGAATNRFFPTLGNHDLYATNGLAYLRYFTLPGNGRYYDFVRGNVHFFALNSDPAEPDGIGRHSRQARWLREQLAASTAPWKVVYFHHAPYSSGHHGNTPGMQWPFREWGASMVLAGHDHHYERLIIDDLPYFVNGLGGRSLYEMDRRAVSGSQVRYNADYGAMLLRASADTLRLRFVTRTGQLIDNYALIKGLPARSQLYPVVPNPLRASTEVAFAVPTPGRVRLRVLSNRGQEVQRLFEGEVQPGHHKMRWDCSRLAAGVYLVVLEGAEGRLTQRVVMR